jgi:polyketide synthase 5
MVSTENRQNSLTSPGSPASRSRDGEMPATAVAVIGMACRLPGGIDSPELLWEALLRGDDLVTEIPRDRWDPDDFYDPEPGVPGRSVSKWGAFLDDVTGFDAEFFGMGEREADLTDPQHRMLLETSWEAMEHAGLTRDSLVDSKTGVFLGLTHNDYQLLAADSGAAEKPYGFMASSFSLASGRIAYALGLHGPAITVDTACSSGLVAIHLACRSLHEHESDMAVAGGVALAFDPRKWAAGSAEGMLSATGRCHAFDVDADGFVAGEACVVLMLKRYVDAVRDDDRILAVIRGTASNQDGRTVNIATPSESAQIAAYREALEVADVAPGTVGMVEAHGTGTPTGDPIEYASLAAVYGIDGPCALGSSKTNFGHTQSASGALGLLKTVLALQHGVVPQNLHFNRLPDKMAQIDTKLFVPQQNTPWPTNGGAPRRAAVSAYGVSGTNVHAVLEQAPEPRSAQAAATDVDPGEPLLFLLSSTSPEEVRRTAGRLADWLDRHTEVALPDLAYTLARRRAHRPVRASVIAGTRDELITALREVADGDTPFQPAVGHDDRGPVWVFSGQGSQWAAMGAQLLETEPVFAATVAQVEGVIAEESGFSVTEAMSSPETVTGQERVQPTLFTMQVAIAATLRSYGVTPAAVIGHSLGEAAAAVAAGALSVEDGARVVCRRSRLMRKVAGSGATASVELPAQQVLSELMARGIQDVVVAVVASPQSTVVAGAAQTVHDLVAEWEQRDVMARIVPTDVAFHSPQVDPILGELTEALADIAPHTPEIPFYSATLFDPRDEASFDARYWADNCRRMVRFATAVQAALEDGHRVFTELSPHPLLVRALEQTGQHVDVPMTALAGMRREQQMPYGLRGFVADTHAAGARVDFSVLHPRGRLVDAPLPTWTHHRHWLEDGGQEAPMHGACLVSVHPLLGEHVRLQEEPERHVWQGEVGTAAHPWLGDHQVRNVAVLPGAAYCEMALAAGEVVLGDSVEVRDIRFERALLLDEKTSIGSAAAVTVPGVVSFTVETTQEGEPVRQAVATVRAAADETPPAYDMAALLASRPDREEGDDIRRRMDRRGLQYGPAFSGLGAVLTGDGEESVLAEVALPRQIRSQQDAYRVHPALLDACFQSVESHPRVRALGDGALGLPLGIARLRIYGPARNVQYCHTKVTSAGLSGVEADIDLLDEHGTVLISVGGLRLGSGVSEEAAQERVLSERLLTVEWRRRDLAEVEYADAGSWLLIGTDATATTALAEALESHGAHSITLSWPSGADHSELTQSLQDQVRTGGVSGVVVLCTAGTDDGQAPEEGRDAVRQVVRIARELAEVTGEPPRFHVVTRSAQNVLTEDRVNLAQTGLRGLLRVLAIEQPHLRATQIDVDAATPAERVAQQLLAGSDEDETAWRDGQWYVARLTPAPLQPEERRRAVIDNADAGMRLHVARPGDLESMEYLARQRVSPGPGQIEVAVHASSLNFADVLVAFGRYPAFDGRLPQLGIDFAGVVTAVGPGVTDHRVGDRVGGLTADGSWGTYITCEADLAATLPDGLGFNEAAALTIATATAWYGLVDMARLQAGDKVLIHSGTGGVGQAAIAIARSVGAEIYATAGSEKRRQVLRDMGIEHVYDSRSIEFAEQIRNDTDGYGVDVVLNSVPGPAQRAGLELLAFGGRFVEIGKRDIYGDTRIGLFPFRRNLSFYAVDLALMSVSHPRRIHDLLQTVYQRTAEGALPMPACTTYPLAEAATAIRVMSGARHTGKLVLEIPRAGTTEVVVPADQVPVFRNDGAYIVTGGLGGLGLFLAERMADGGCGRIVLSSRSAPSAQALDTIERIRATGTDVVVESADITDPATAPRLVQTATATGLPLRGVLHAAALIEDATVPNITDDLLERDWGAKVRGAWHLHTATADEPLDWFCLFSSAAALVGSPGQGAYAAANSWLDGFTRWRRAQGLPATTIAWGAWSEIGAGTALAEGTGAAITPDEGAYAFDTLLRFDRAYTGYAPIMNAPWLEAFAASSPFAEAFRSDTQSGAGTARLRAELEELPREEWPIRLRRLISDQVSLILRRSVDPDRPLAEYGMDSLGALELRTRIESETGVRISAKDMTTTIRDLAGQLCDELMPAEAA